MHVHSYCNQCSSLLPIFKAYCTSSLFSWLTISCNQKCSVMLRMRQIRWGSSRRSPDLLVVWGRRYHTPPYFLSLWRLRRLVLGASPWVGEGNLLQELRGTDAPGTVLVSLPFVPIITAALILVNGERANRDDQSWAVGQIVEECSLVVKFLSKNAKLGAKNFTFWGIREKTCHFVHP